MTVSDVFRVIDVQKDRHRRRSVRLDKRIDQDVRETAFSSRESVGWLANGASSGSLSQAIFNAGSWRSVSASFASS
jgi:hypothetical protein